MTRERPRSLIGRTAPGSQPPGYPRARRESLHGSCRKAQVTQTVHVEQAGRCERPLNESGCTEMHPDAAGLAECNLWAV